jgi:hypothetical protein
MATFLSKEENDIGLTPPVFPDPTVYGSGGVQFKVKGPVAAAALTDAAAIVKLMKPRKGTLWDPNNSFFTSPGNAGDNGATLAVGIPGTVDKFYAATSGLNTTSPVKKEMSAAVAGAGYEFDGDTWIIATVGTHAIADLDLYVFYLGLRGNKA